MTALTPEQANFDHYVGTIENLEKNDAFLSGNGSQAFEALTGAFTLFREARDSGLIGDDEWGRIEKLTEDRATSYRVAKDESGRLGVLNQYQPQTSPQGDSSKDLADWIDRERSIMESRPDAALYRGDWDFASDQILTSKIRDEENADGSFAPWDLTKRAAAGFAGTIAMAVDTEGTINRDIDRWLATDPSRDENFISEVSQGLGSVGAAMAVFIGGTGVTKNPLIGGTVASTAFNGMVRYNEGYRAAKDLGAPEGVASKAGMYSTPAAFVDTLGDMFIAGKLGKGIAQTLRLGGGTLPRNAILNRMAYGIVEQGSAQAASEVAGDLTAAAGQSVATGNTKIWEEAIARAPRTAAVSFTLGGLFGGAGGIREGAQINEVKRAAQELGVDPMDLVKITKSGQIDITETVKALEQARLDKEAAENPEPPKASTDSSVEQTQEAPTQEPAPTMRIKTWADAFIVPIGPTVGGGYDLNDVQIREINSLGAKIDELVEERDNKERAGVPYSDLKRYDQAMNSLIEGMMAIANSKTEVSEAGSADTNWSRYTKAGEFRSREQAQKRADQLGRKASGFVYEPVKIDPGDGTAFHYELNRRPIIQKPFSGEVMARAVDIEMAFRDAEAAKARFDEAVAAVEENQATDVTAETINRLLGIPGAPASFELISGPYERGSDAVAARQAMEDSSNVVARKEGGQWNLYKRTPEQRGSTEEAADAEESARVIAEQSPIDPFDLIPGDEEFGLEVERQIEGKFRNRKRRGPRGSVLLPGSEDFKQAAKDGAAFFSSGIQKFSEWSEAMVEKFGEGIRNSLDSIWQTIKESLSQILANTAERINQQQEASGDVLRSGIAPSDLAPLKDIATNALLRAQRMLDGAQESVVNEEISTPEISASSAADKVRNTATPPNPAVESKTTKSAFAQGWRQGVRDMRAGVKGAVETLSDMLESSELKGLTAGEYRTLSRILSRRNLTTEDSIIIEELGEVAIAGAKHRERLSTLRQKNKKARRKLDTEHLGIAVVENTHKSPLLGTDTVIDVMNTDQPVVLARAITMLSPSEAAYIESNESRPFPGFLDAYEAALDLINSSTRASQVDVESFQSLVEQAASYNKDIKRIRIKSRLSAIRGDINKAEANGDNVDSINLMYDQVRSDSATASTQLEFDGVNDQISDILGQLEKLPSNVASSQEAQAQKLKIRNTAINRATRLSSELQQYIDNVKNIPGGDPNSRGIPEPIRSAVYGAFTGVTPEHLENFSTLDIEGIGDVIEQVKRLAQSDDRVDAVFNRFSTRMMGNLGALKLLDRHKNEIENLYNEVQPNSKLTPAQKSFAAFRNNWFVRYLTEQQSAKLSELPTTGLIGSFGLTQAQNLLHLGDVLNAPGLVSTELFGRTDSLRTRGEAKGQALMAPIVEGLKKLKSASAALSSPLRQQFAKRGLDKTATGIPLVQDLPFQGQNTRALDSMTVVNMALLIRQLDHNNERGKLLKRLNVSDPMIQWIEGGHEKGAAPNASSLPEDQQKRLKDIWSAMTEAAGGNEWHHIEKILTDEQLDVIKSIDSAMDSTGRAVRSTSAVIRNTLLPEIVSYFPLQGSRVSPENLTDDEVLNARLDPGLASAPETIRPSSSHVRKQWTQPQTFDLQGTLMRHLIAVNVDAELTPHLYQTEIAMRKLRNQEAKLGKPATTKWQTLVNGLRREHRRVAGMDVAISSMFMSGGHRGLTAVQKLLRRGVLAQVHKPIAEALSLGWIFGNRIGWDKFTQATRDYNQNKEAFRGLMFDNGSTFMQRTGLTSADIQIENHGSYRGIKMRPSRSVIEQENPEMRPGIWGWLEETKMSKMSNWATRVITSYGDHAVSSPAMYSMFMDKFRTMMGKPFKWQDYFDGMYNSKAVKEVMLQTDIEFQKLAAPNTSGLVSALRNQSSTSALVRMVKNILFPYSHFAANEKSNFFRGLRQGFNPNNSFADRKAGFYQAATHAIGNTVYQLAMFNLGKIIVAAAGGAIASALGDGEDDEMARRFKEISEELLDPENHVRKGIGGLIDTATGSNDPWTRGLIGWTLNKANKAFTEKALARPYDPFDDDIVYVRDIDSAKGIASYLVGPYSRLIEDAFKFKDDVDYLIDPEKSGSGWARATNIAALAAGYTVGLPAQTTINKIIKDSSKTYSDPDYKQFNEGLKSKEINNHVRFLVEKQGNTPQAMAMYLRSLNNEDAIVRAIRYYSSYTKDKKKMSPDVMKTARGVLNEFRAR